MSRRATFILAIAGVAGVVTQPNRARTESRTSEDDGPMSAATADEVGGLRSAKADSVSQFQNLKTVSSERQVVTIYHDRSTFEVMTADGRNAVFPDASLRIKIDSSDNGPPAGRPVILPGGMMGDRATVFFASPAEISDLIKYRG
jgi:cytochrome c